MDMNIETQTIFGVRLRLIERNYRGYQAKRYTLFNTNQNVWIPNTCLSEDGTIINTKKAKFFVCQNIKQILIAHEDYITNQLTNKDKGE
jgi:hypothetical protein